MNDLSDKEWSQKPGGKIVLLNGIKKEIAGYSLNRHLTPCCIKDEIWKYLAGQQIKYLPKENIIKLLGLNEGIW